MNKILKNKKKFILVLVLLILFNFCCPRNIVIAASQNIGSIEDGKSTTYKYGNYETGKARDAGNWFDLSTNFASLLFWIERGVYALVNNIFSDSEHQYEYTVRDIGNDTNKVYIKIYLTPESIIKGKYLLFDADIFDDVSADLNDTEKYYDDAGESIVDGKNELRKTISGWYTALRNLAIVALLSVLVYVGIRMIMSTVAQDKAKYKMMFKDWLVALCLVIVMHYIMIAILDMSSLVVDAIGTSGAAASQTEEIMEKIGSITVAEKGFDITYNGKTTEDVRAIYSDDNDNLELYTIGDAYAYELLLLVMMFYTVLFAVKYLKREFTIIFLILLGPISCITYPIDKISDGKAQAFNRWFAEFLYQVIIQPFHLLIYIVLVGTAQELANDNLLYSIVCFAVMIPAEKFIKEMFGFKDKLGSPLGAMATGALGSQLFKNAFSGGTPKSPKGNSVEGKSESDSGIRESKLKPGLPGGENGTGTPTSYDSEDNNTPSPEGDNTDAQVDENGNPQQDMIDAYDENYNTDEWDAQERDAMARELNNGSNGMNYTDDEYEQILRDSGYTEDEIADMMKDNSGEGENPQQDMLNAYDENYNTDEWDAQERDAMARELNNGSNGMNYTDDEYEQILRDSGYTEDEIANMMKDDSEEGGNTETPEVGDEGTTNASPEEETEPMQTTGIYSPKEKSRFTNALSGVREHRDKKLMAKYGTKNRGIALAKYTGKKASSIGKKAIKGATTLVGAAALGTLGFMMGQGNKGALAGASLGANIGNKINGGLSSAYASAKEYGTEASYAMKNEEERRKARVKKMMKSPDQIERASQSFSKRNSGKIANTAELNQELADRARFKEMKLSDDEIDNAMEVYGNNKDKLGEEGALQMAYASANLASRYSAKDFEDPKKMENAYKNLMREYEALGVNQDLADENVRDIINNAGSIYGIKNPVLPTPSRKQEYMSNQANIDKAKASYARRKGTGPNKQQLNQELEMGFNLRKAGISEEDRETFFNSYITDQDAIDGAIEILGENATEEEINTELERRFEIKVKLNKDDMTEKELTSHINAAETFVKNNNQIKQPTNGQVFAEVKQRVTVQDSYHISSGSQQEINQRINDIRSDEAKFVKESEDRDGARAVIAAQRAEAVKTLKDKNPEESKRMQRQAEYQRDFLARYSAEQMRDDKIMEKEKKRIMKQLEKSGSNYSPAYREIFANEVIAKGKQYVGIED